MTRRRIERVTPPAGEKPRRESPSLARGTIRPAAAERKMNRLTMTPRFMAGKKAEKIGPINVNVGNTACQVPFAPDYIRKAEKRGAIGKKRKTVKC